METLGWKVRLVALWLIAAEAVSGHMIIVTIDPIWISYHSLLLATAAAATALTT